MEQRSLIKMLFGKETGITKEDIETKIIGIVTENSLIDYKRVDTLFPEMNQSKARCIVMKEIVAFLNKIQSEGGVVALGIDAKEKTPTRIFGVDDSIIKNDSVLRNWILCDISSMPHALQFPDIEIVTINIEKDKKVYFIEIHPKDINVLYFSRCDDYTYIREIDTTRKLSFEESVRIIDIKKTAKIFANLEQINCGIEEDSSIYTMKVVFNNLGNKPASNVTAMFLFNCEYEGGNWKDIKVDFFDTHNIQETSNINVCSKSFQQNFNRLFYPERPVVVGNFTIRFPRAHPIQLILEIDEQSGRTKQVFAFNEIEFKKLSGDFFVY